eukprot:CAMPEP_0172577740 /NCGR_PEP_ID=MMETSP1067-20121228/138384_1 /TAXON_ID=265564 ORGANISM="Thalassiosira punctigera, Strain Tpunct2005C2" /NCGR_SAMPLE_ID=MMETSP1067 /ASSEMBLY_ACC=CAM_ASM_000444 /LENGTH=203 /DNA_ID=CAMNT_0013370431 /DNA_START=64 /DNA_END=675 /DNA_ORIENTATION=+
MSSERSQQSTIMGEIMKFFLPSVHSVLYSPLARSQFESSAAVANMSSLDRESLVHEIVRELDREEAESGLAGLEGVIDQCRSSLESFERKERFVGVRLGRYRALMARKDARVGELTERTRSSRRRSDEEDLEDNGTSDRLDELRAAHDADRERLRSVEELHKNFIAEVEVLRRRIGELEEKRKDMMAKREECRDFLVAAAEFT